MSAWGMNELFICNIKLTNCGDENQMKINDPACDAKFLSRDRVPGTDFVIGVRTKINSHRQGRLFAKDIGI